MHRPIVGFHDNGITSCHIVLSLVADEIFKKKSWIIDIQINKIFQSYWSRTHVHILVLIWLGHVRTEIRIEIDYFVLIDI